ncbi:MAG: hypothetical protein ABI721_05085 [Candidatus Dojkabacteria bacterium]
MKKIVLNIFILAVLALSAFSFLPSSSTTQLGPQTLCAASDLATGLACLNNISTCSDGGHNLFNDTGVTSLFNGEINIVKIEQAIINTGASFAVNLPGGLEANRNKFCLSGDAKAIIPAYQKQSDTPINTDLAGYGGGIDLRYLPRKCIGLLDTPSQDLGIATASIYGAGWGCCPSGYQFLLSSSHVFDVPPSIVTDFSGEGIRNNYSACCPGGSTHWLPTASNVDGIARPAGCLDENFNIIATPDDSRVVKSSDNSAIQGAGLNTAESFSIGPQTGANQLCPSQSVCAATDTGVIVNASDLRSNSALVCAKCYSEGEAIKISADGNSLIRCSSSGSDSAGQPVEEIGLCNNSASDTLACLSGGRSDNENYSFCCTCRVRGGVWTGIGCTDTTPLGIITGIIRIVFGVVGGVALIQLIIAGIMYQTGDEARIKSARESIIKTLTGLAVLVFSILILRIIGINILDVLPVGSI